MFETTKTSPFHKALLWGLGNRLVVHIEVAMIFFSLVSTVRANPDNRSDIVVALSTSQTVPPQAQDTVRANPYNRSDIVAALSTSQTVPPKAQDLASRFVDHTLPKLLADDARGAARLGFGGTMNKIVALEQALPLMIMHHDDVLKLSEGRSDLVDLLNNTNNWIPDPSGKLTPRRMIFSLKMDDGTSEYPPHAWSSVTLEYSPSGSWRVFQAGAPKLAQTMNLYQVPGKKYFLLWLPELNRHYLAQMGSDAAASKTVLTTLFNDPLAGQNPGEQFEVTDPQILNRLKKLSMVFQSLRLSRESNLEQH